MYRNTCVIQVYILHMYCMCRTCVLHMYRLHMYYTSISTHVIHRTCITDVAQLTMYYLKIVLIKSIVISLFLTNHSIVNPSEKWRGKRRGLAFFWTAAMCNIAAGEYACCADEKSSVCTDPMTPKKSILCSAPHTNCNISFILDFIIIIS